MKKAFVSLAALIVTSATLGQGTIQFNNRLTASGIDAKIFMPGGIVGLSSPYFKAQIYAGPEGSGVESFAPVTPVTTFRTGIAAGYVNPIDLVIPGISPGAKATIVVRFYNGLTFESSTIYGSSAPITITLGGAGIPPTLPAELVGLTSFTSLPEPSTIALGVLGAGILLLRRWQCS